MNLEKIVLDLCSYSDEQEWFEFKKTNYPSWDATKSIYISKSEISQLLGISTTSIDKNIAFLRKNGYIERVGKTKGGYWKVLK